MIMNRDCRRRTRVLPIVAGSALIGIPGAISAQDTHDHSRPEQSDQHGTHVHRPEQVPISTDRSQSRHVPPDPPLHPMSDMSKERMIELMGMDDGAGYSMLRIDQLEWRDIDHDDAMVWDAQAFHGDDYNKALLKLEGSRTTDEYESTSELLWDRIFSRWWSAQLGIRHDASEGPSRTWAAFGAQGLAPYWFEVEATLYVGEQGRTAFKASAEQDLLLTQRLILRPALEVEAYGKDDPANGIGSGLSSLELGLRLRYEIRREVAPYIGMVWSRRYGETADFARADGLGEDDLQFVAGLRLWF
jgi:copper resistance protein B